MGVDIFMYTLNVHIFMPILDVCIFMHKSDVHVFIHILDLRIFMHTLGVHMFMQILDVRIFIHKSDVDIIVHILDVHIFIQQEKHQTGASQACGALPLGPRRPLPLSPCWALLGPPEGPTLGPHAPQDLKMIQRTKTKN